MDMQDMTTLGAVEGQAAPSEVSPRYLSLMSFHQLASKSGGHSYIKVVWDRDTNEFHLVDGHKYSFHVDYIAECILLQDRFKLRENIDSFNAVHYFAEQRRFYLGTVSLHTSSNGPFFVLETSEVDTMNGPMLEDFWGKTVQHVDPSIQVVLKPANHGQEQTIAAIDGQKLPRVFHHELYGTAAFVALNSGVTKGRIRLFESEAAYKKGRATIKWYDIIVMDRIPDDVPRVAGMIMNRHTTPLSHTNVLACSWQIPNAVQVGIVNRIKSERLDSAWVNYGVEVDKPEISLEALPDRPPETIGMKPTWMTARIRLESPDMGRRTITSLKNLRRTDHHRYGTKAANLGELFHIISDGSKRLTGYYRVPRPPRPNLLGYLEALLDRSLENKAGTEDIEMKASRFIQTKIRVPRGIAIPFSVQQAFLESSPTIQQCIGKLKMALELDAIEADSLAVQLQNLIRSTRMSDAIRDQIDGAIAQELAGVSSFIVRSSSNAEDLKGFPAAGMYESINHLTTSDKIFESIKEVWASLVSPRSVRLRHDVGISLDDCYMGVIIQEELQSDYGGVMVTTNPTKGPSDFRNVFINASKTAESVVNGGDDCHQFMFNAVEGGGRTLAQMDRLDLGEAGIFTRLQELSVAGKMLSGHFSSDYTFSEPVDIEWMIRDGQIYLLQLRPYGS